MANYLILLPTSETKVKGGDESKPSRIVKNYKNYNSFIALETDRDFLYSKLREAINEQNEEELQNTFDLKGKNLQEAVEINSDLLNEPTMNAISRYSGVMFNSIQYAQMKENQKKNFENNVIFFDSMFGLLRPLDLIPDYKLKINSTFLDINTIKFWKKQLNGYFEYLFKEKIVINLLPEAHTQMITLPDKSNFITINFCEIKTGKLSNTGHNSKKLKGELINFITSKEFISIQDLYNFKHSLRYEYSKEYSSENLIVYLKK